MKKVDKPEFKEMGAGGEKKNKIKSISTDYEDDDYVEEDGCAIFIFYFFLYFFLILRVGLYLLVFIVLIIILILLNAYLIAGWS